MMQATTNARIRSLVDLPSPRALPVLGNALQLDPARLHLVLEEWCRHLGETYTFGLGPKRIFVSTNPEHLQTALRERPERWSAGDPADIREVMAFTMMPSAMSVRLKSIQPG
jgi:hypothetical protein